MVGLGAIGGLVADTAIRLGLRVVGYDPQITAETVSRLPASVRLVASVDEAFATADFVTLHVPLVESTRHLADARRLALCPKGAVLLNFSRDAIVDEEAVVAAVASGRLKAYVCDFPSPRFAGQAGIVALPHLGASTEEAEENSAAMVIDQLRDFLEEGTVRNAVNFPAVEMPRESPHRVAIANANVPNMLGKISTTMAAASLNIHNMVNKSKGEMAYTLVDLDSEVGEDVLARLSRIPGVLSVRLVPPLAEPRRMSAELDRLRGEIDRIDREILERLNERAQLARAIGTLKVGQAYRPEREAQVLRRIKERNPGPLGDETVACSSARSCRPASPSSGRSPWPTSGRRAPSARARR